MLKTVSNTVPKTVPSKPLIIGLTGNIATGKSTIMAYLAKKGAHIIDADKLVHEAMAPNGPAYDEIIGTFGTEILDQDAVARPINRRLLGQIVFGDADALKQLEGILHPRVSEMTQARIASSTARVIILEAIKLLESGRMINLCDEVWVSAASAEAQLARLMADRGMERAEAMQRMAVQSPQEEKIRQADRVIHNNGTEEELHAQLERLWKETVERDCEKKSRKENDSK